MHYLSPIMFAYLMLIWMAGILQSAANTAYMLLISKIIFGLSFTILHYWELPDKISGTPLSQNHLQYNILQYHYGIK